MPSLRDLFDSTPPGTIGLEEEVWLLDGETLDLTPRVDELLGRLSDDPRFKPELPAAQVEIVTAPAADVDEALAQLAAGRRDLAAAAAALGCRLAGSGVHPFAASEGVLNPAPRYDLLREEYGPIARRQLVSSLQVHVAVGGAERSLSVYNALRSHLPSLAARAANAPVYGGVDTGLASVRPFISELLPRQGVPPALASWEAYEEALRAVGEPRLWWWELRPHVVHGTLEIRVPDAQTTLAESRAVVEAVLSTIENLQEGPPEETWRIEERRWRAARHGAPDAPGAARQRAAFSRAGARGVADALAAGFSEGLDG